MTFLKSMRRFLRDEQGTETLEWGLICGLIVVGAILLFALNINLPFVSDDTLGIILIVAGALALILALVMQAQRGRTRHVQENRYDGSPPVA